jgi:hypothetical protein
MKSFICFLSSKTVFVLAVALLLGCSFWIYKNINLSDLTGTSTTEIKPVVSLAKETVGVELKLEIRNGDIVQVLSPDLVKLVVSHSKLEGVDQIISLSYSTIINKMCFIAETITPKWMYVGNTDGTGLNKVALASTCEISQDGAPIAFINHVTDVSRTDVYLYDFEENKITNLTENNIRKGYQRNYMSIQRFGGVTIEASYKDWLKTDYQTSINGTSLIDISTGSVSEKVN